jgi:hypothetical protein
VGLSATQTLVDVRIREEYDQRSIILTKIKVNKNNSKGALTIQG